MIKLRRLIEEIEDDQTIDVDRLVWNQSYLDDVAERLGYDDDFNKHFWNQHYMPMLYHCTSKENYEKIQKDGVLKRQSGSRGISNRHIGATVFATRYEEEIPFFKSYYGPIVLGINTDQMKKDGYMPSVEQEPDWAYGIKMAFVMNKIQSGGREREAAEFVDSSDQNTEGTVILYGNIPSKYLSVVEED